MAKAPRNASKRPATAPAVSAQTQTKEAPGKIADQAGDAGRADGTGGGDQPRSGAPTIAALVNKASAEGYPLLGAALAALEAAHPGHFGSDTVLRITAKQDGFRRAGQAHEGSKDYAPDTFTPAQIEQLLAEPMLVTKLLIAEGH